MPFNLTVRKKEVRAQIIASNKNLSLRALLEGDGQMHSTIGKAIGHPGFWIVAIYRLSHWFSYHGLDVIGRILQLLNQFIFNCEISRRADIGPGLCIYHPLGIFIGPMVVIGRHCQVGPHVFIGSRRRYDDPDDYPVLGEGVFLGTAAQIYGGIVVGDRVHVGPGAILFQDVPDGHVIASPRSRSMESGVWKKEKFP